MVKYDKKWWIRNLKWITTSIVSLSLIFLEFSIIWSFFQFLIVSFNKIWYNFMIYQNKNKNKILRHKEFYLPNLIFQVVNQYQSNFWKILQQEEILLIFQNQNMKMKPILLSIKLVNKGSSSKSNLSNRANLVNSIGIEPIKEIEYMTTRSKISSFINKPEKLFCFDLKFWK